MSFCILQNPERMTVIRTIYTLFSGKVAILFFDVFNAS